MGNKCISQSIKSVFRQILCGFSETDGQKVVSSLICSTWLALSFAVILVVGHNEVSRHFTSETITTRNTNIEQGLRIFYEISAKNKTSFILISILSFLAVNFLNKSIYTFSGLMAFNTFSSKRAKSLFWTVVQLYFYPTVGMPTTSYLNVLSLCLFWSRCDSLGVCSGISSQMGISLGFLYFTGRY